MSEFQCNTCKVYFNKKSHLINHKNRKNKCEPVIEHLHKKTTIFPQKTIIEAKTPIKKPQKIKNQPQKTIILTENLPSPIGNPETIKNEPMVLQDEILVERFPCEHCNKSFVRKDVLQKHIKEFCPVVKQQNKEKQDIFERLLLLETKNKQLEEEIKNKEIQYEKTIKNKDDVIKNKDDVIKDKDDVIKNLASKNNILQTITINNTLNVINIVSHGNENLIEKQVAELMLTLAARKGMKVVDELISLVHLNSTFPEYQNIYLPDIKNNRMMVYDYDNE